MSRPPTTGIQTTKPRRPAASRARRAAAAATPKAAAKGRRHALAFLEPYLEVLSGELKATVIAALRGSEAAKPEMEPPPSIVGPDSDAVFIDLSRTPRACPVADLPPDLRRTVEEAIVRPHETLPRSAALAEASRILHPHLRGLPEAERIALVVAVAERLMLTAQHELFFGVCPACGASPTPGAPLERHVIQRWLPSGRPELICPNYTDRGGRPLWLGPSGEVQPEQGCVEPLPLPGPGGEAGGKKP